MKKRPNQSQEKRQSLRERAEKLVAGKHVNLDDLSKTDILTLIHELQVHQIELEMQNEELRRSQSALEESRNKYSDLYDFAPVGYFSLNENGLILEVNLTSATLLGIERKDLIKQPFVSYVAKDKASLFYTYLKRLLETATRQTCELKILNRNISIYVQLEGIAIFEGDGNGRFSHFRIAMLNITERKRMEKELSAEKERLAVTLSSIGECVITTDTEGRILLINAVAETLTGWGQEEAVGRPITEVFQIINENTRQPYENPVEEVMKTGKISRFSGNTILVERDGTERIIADSSSPIRLKDGTIIGVVLVFGDITNSIIMERELLMTGRLESVGVLAGGIAHDFNNLLTVILGNISLARFYAKPGDRVFERLIEAEKASLRATGLTQQLLTFTKGGAPIKKTTSIAKLLEDSVKFALMGSNVRCEFSISDDLWPVEVDEGQINQAINNLIINANQAMPEGGVIKLIAENITIGAENTNPLIKDGKYIRISVEDHGPGIPKEHISRIYEPYFTTKGKGSGLGLATTYSIIKKHNGYITVESEVGVGTTFYIYLPASDKKILDKKEVEGGLIKGQGKVLIMDDEESIRDLVSNILVGIGYKVEFAKDGAEAIELYKRARESGQPFDAVILDLTIPGGMGGKETIKRLLEIDPEVKAIVSSGYSNDPIMAEFSEYGFMDVIAKPYRIEELSRALHQLIMRNSEARS